MSGYRAGKWRTGSLRARAALTRSDAGFTLPELLVVTVILLVTMSMTATVMVTTQRTYSAQRERVATANEARAAVDMISRIVRMSGNNPFSIAITPLDPDPDGNNAFDSLRVQADWNPADGDIADAYEDITFSVANGRLMKLEPADSAPVPFAENVASLVLTYTDTNGAPILVPAAAGRIAYATVAIGTTNTSLVQDGPPLTVTTSVAIRRLE